MEFLLFNATAAPVLSQPGAPSQELLLGFPVQSPLAEHLELLEPPEGPGTPTLVLGGQWEPRAILLHAILVKPLLPWLPPSAQPRVTAGVTAAITTIPSAISRAHAPAPPPAAGLSHRPAPPQALPHPAAFFQNSARPELPGSSRVTATKGTKGRPCHLQKSPDGASCSIPIPEQLLGARSSPLSCVTAFCRAARGQSAAVPLWGSFGVGCKKGPGEGRPQPMAGQGRPRAGRRQADPGHGAHLLGAASPVPWDARSMTGMSGRSLSSPLLRPRHWAPCSTEPGSWRCLLCCRSLLALQHT